MKKILIRILGALFILGAVFIMFSTPWVKVDGIKRSEIKDLREVIDEDLNTTQETILYLVEDEDFKDDMKDYDLPVSKAKIKERIKTTRTLSKNLLDMEISLQDLTTMSFQLPGLIRDTDNLLSTEYVADIVITDSQLMEQEDLEDLVESVEDFSLIFYLMGVLIIILVVLGVASAVTHCLNGGRFIKYIYLVFIVMLVVGLCVTLPMISEIIQSEDTFIEALEDMSLVVTPMPFIAVALMIVPIVLDIIFERKNKKMEEQING